MTRGNKRAITGLIWVGFGQLSATIGFAYIVSVAHYLMTYHFVSYYRIAYYLFLLPIAFFRCLNLLYIYIELLKLALIDKVLIFNRPVL